MPLGTANIKHFAIFCTGNPQFLITGRAVFNVSRKIKKPAMWWPVLCKSNDGNHCRKYIA